MLKNHNLKTDQKVKIKPTRSTNKNGLRTCIKNIFDLKNGREQIKSWYIEQKSSREVEEVQRILRLSVYVVLKSIQVCELVKLN